MAKYAEMLAKSEKELAAEQSTLAVANGKASVEQEVSRLTAKQATLDIAFNSALASNPFNYGRVSALAKEKAGNEEELKFASTLLKELF